VGEITMDNELLYAKIEALEGKAAPRNRRIGSHRDVRRGFPTRGALHIVGS
jgi:hypothetical protein